MNFTRKVLLVPVMIVWISLWLLFNEPKTLLLIVTPIGLLLAAGYLLGITIQ